MCESVKGVQRCNSERDQIRKERRCVYFSWSAKVMSVKSGEPSGRALDKLLAEKTNRPLWPLPFFCNLSSFFASLFFDFSSFCFALTLSVKSIQKHHREERKKKRKNKGRDEAERRAIDMRLSLCVALRSEEE